MAPEESVPDRYDMRKYLWKVEDVHPLHASVASALATALEYHANRIGIEQTNLSTLFIHYNARLIQGAAEADNSVLPTVDSALKAIAKFGACRNDTWPLDASKLTVKPPQAAYDEALKFAGVACNAPIDVTESIAKHYPVTVIALVPNRCLVEAGRTGVMPNPTADEIRAGTVEQAFTLVGYDKPARTYAARTCWGADWGQDGYCTISFDALESIAPAGSGRRWFLYKEAATRDPMPATMAQAPAAPGAGQGAGQVGQKLSDLAASLRQEIRDDLQKDLAESARRIREMVGRPAGGPQQPDAAAGVCPACGGHRLCPHCRGRGCDRCGNSGRCAKCGGRGTV